MSRIGTVARRWLGRMRQRWARVLERHVRPWILRHRVTHVSGPREIDYGEGEVLLISVVRNGEFHVRSFLEHHFRLGVRHVVLLDNGSTDRTVEIAREFPDVTVLRTKCPYRSYENTMKRYLARRFSRNRWNLCVDMDERFDYPGSDVIRLPDLVRRMNQRGHTAAVAQMLDLFPDCTLAELGCIDDVPMEEAHVFYDLANIRTTDYTWGVLSSPAVRMHWDGIRNTLFGTVHGLTKAALVRVEDGAELFVDWHHFPAARISDLTCVLRHYPFAGSFHAKVQDAVENFRYGQFSVTDYGRYWRQLQSSPETPFRQPTTRRWDGVDALVEQGFLVAPPEYLREVAVRRSSRPPRGTSSAAEVEHG